jgi:hypothetical protein
LVVTECAEEQSIEIWQGKITTDPDEINGNPKKVIRALINQYGKNFEDDIRFPRDKWRA